MTERALPDLEPPGTADRGVPGDGILDSPADAAAQDAVVVAHQPDHGARNNRVIWLLLGATFVVILNETIMGVAIPHLITDLGITLSQAQWLTTAFMLTMAVVIPITGFLLQRIRHPADLHRGDEPVLGRHAASPRSRPASRCCCSRASCRPPAPPS